MIDTINQHMIPQFVIELYNWIPLELFVTLTREGSGTNNPNWNGIK